jgi:hypothetical protein
MVLATIYLRVITPFCLLEMFFHEMFAVASRTAASKLSIPRVSTWGYARLYCDMVSSMTTSIADNGITVSPRVVTV